MDEILKNEEQVVRAVNYLASQGGKFGLTYEVMRRMKPTPSELYVNARFSAGGTAHLLSGNSTQEVGVTNFDGNSLQVGRFFVANAITLQYGEAAADKKVWEVDYKDELPAVLLASHLVLRQNGEALIKLPVSAIQNAKKTESYYRFLEALALIEPQSTVELLVETPQGSTITPSGSNVSFVRVLVKGFETILKR